MGRCVYCGEEEVSIDGDYVCDLCQSIPKEERVQILGSIIHFGEEDVIDVAQRNTNILKRNFGY